MNKLDSKHWIIIGVVALGLMTTISGAKDWAEVLTPKFLGGLGTSVIGAALAMFTSKPGDEAALLEARYGNLNPPAPGPRVPPTTLAVVLLCLLLPAIASAQVTTEPTAFAPQYRGFADGLGTALVVVAGEEAARYSIVEWRNGNRTPAYRNACSIASAMTTIEILKRHFPETRPDGSNQASWPSGHSAALASFQGRHLSIDIVLTVSGGLSRAWANKHHLFDGGEGEGRGKGKDIPIGWLIGTLARAGCEAFIRS